jgi:ribosomal protein S18 acetylase RimI-like enzyme
VVLFAYSDAPGLVPYLLARDFAVERYLYLSAGLTNRSPHAAGPWPTYDHARHAAKLAALLASAYPLHDRARPFVRTNQPHEWARYVSQLVTETGCGAFLPDVSFLAPDNSSTRLDGATLATRLAAETVHLAQIVVAPDAQGRGLARRLIGVSLEAARAQGFTRATLLVGEGNARARQLYERLGFTEAASFVSAVCDQPRRSTSVGLETGGAITLR